MSDDTPNTPNPSSVTYTLNSYGVVPEQYSADQLAWLIKVVNDMAEDNKSHLIKVTVAVSP